jgi:hypothetical protein
MVMTAEYHGEYGEEKTQKRNPTADGKKSAWV